MAIFVLKKIALVPSPLQLSATPVAAGTLGGFSIFSLVARRVQLPPEPTEIWNTKKMALVVPQVSFHYHMSLCICLISGYLFPRIFFSPLCWTNEMYRHKTSCFSSGWLWSRHLATHSKRPAAVWLAKISPLNSLKWWLQEPERR